MLSQTYSFTDYYHNKIDLSFLKNPFSSEPKHVWIICRFNGQWLLTEHKDRGFEFPGGKVDEGETPEKAAIREIYEETGGIVANISYVGQYKVNAKSEIVVKNIYFAEIEKLEQRDHYFETNGPVLLQELPANIRKNEQFSFIMKDDVLAYSLKKISGEK